MNQATLSVSIVFFNSDIDMLRGVIRSLFIATKKLNETLKFKVFVDIVNNNPRYKKIYLLKNIVNNYPSLNFELRLLQSERNGGYGAGNNISIKSNLSSDFHLVLNPDVYLDEFALLNAVNFLNSNNDVGLLTPKVLCMDTGNIQYLCKRNPVFSDMALRSVSSFFAHKRNYLYEMRDFDYTKVISPVPYPTGCFMFFRMSVLMKIGFFDEGYFLHYEDADVGRAVSLISTTAYVPSVLIHHKWSRGTHNSLRMRLITIWSGLRYLYKWRNK